jgi:hypothetical protein
VDCIVDHNLLLDNSNKLVDIEDKYMVVVVVAYNSYSMMYTVAVVALIYFVVPDHLLDKLS